MLEELRESLAKAADEIFDKIGDTAVSKYFVQGGDRAVPLKVTSRSGSLMQAVLGGVGGIRTVEFGDPVVLTYGVGSPQSSYAVLLHEGGVRSVTPLMRRFFWAKWHSTRTATGTGSLENEKWGRMRYSQKLIYQPRPFLEMAVNDVMPSMQEILVKHTYQALRIEISKIIGKTKTLIGKIK